MSDPDLPPPEEASAESSLETSALMQLTYQELRSLAQAKLARERPGHTLQPTALVHEAWLRLSAQRSPQWANRRHFFVAAAEAMRRILIESARRRHSLRRGGEFRRTEFGDHLAPAGGASDEVLEVDAALTEFEKIEPQKAQLVRLRFYAGLTLEDAAEVIDVSPATAKRYWRFSKAWLHEFINSHRGENSAGA